MTNSKDSEQLITGLLGPGSFFEGKILFEGVLRIDGKVNGEIICKNQRPSTVIITEEAVVEANIIADVIMVSGMLSGNLKAIEKLELLGPGRVEGLVYTSDLSIADGALFQGECVMIRQFSDEDKRILKEEGFYDIHHNNMFEIERSSIFEEKK
ncbi:MAG: polymer-forming cytoskeletal protein [SAR324 cluster bacterium]|nr:polymer-forming cytoskeletal protein [SAR324 cluster bacterium]